MSGRHGTDLSHWWLEKPRVGQKRAGLEPDEFVSAAVYCATRRKLLLNGHQQEDFQQYTKLVIASGDYVWLALPPDIREGLQLEMFGNPLYREPLGYSVFPQSQRWQDRATVIDLTPPETSNIIGCVNYCRELHRLLKMGRKIAGLNTTSRKSIQCAAQAITRMEQAPRDEDWEVETDAPTDFDQLMDYLKAQALLEGESTREITIQVKVKARGRQERSGTLYPERQFDARQIFPEFERFDATRTPGELISRIRL